MTRLVTGLAVVAAIIASEASDARAASPAAQPQERPHVTIVLAGPDAAVARARRAVAAGTSIPVVLELAALPNAPALEAPATEVEALLAQARHDYVDAPKFAQCVHALAGDTLVPDLLVAGRRMYAARVLFWRVACQVAMDAREPAFEQARALAVLELDDPPEIGTASPDVERLVVEARRAVEAQQRVSLRVTADVERAAVSLDGRAAVCVTPCTLPVAPGMHVVRVDADGRNPESRTVQASGASASIAIATTAAPPDLAARQWTARFATSPAIDSAVSVALLASAVRARRLALVTIERERAGGSRLRGVLTVDGPVAARTERTTGTDADLDEAVPTLVRDLLVLGKVVEPPPSLTKRPGFWIAVGAAVVASAAVTAYVLYQPPTRTDVSFK